MTTEKGYTEEGIRYLKEALSVQPDAPNFHYQLGHAYLKAGRLQEAKQEMAMAGKIQANDREKQAEQLSGKLPSPPALAQGP